MWQKESLGLGDWIVWRDEAIETEGSSAFVSPGMKGQVLSLHDGAYLDVVKGSILPRALVEFENGMRLLVDQRMKWEKMLSIEEGGTK